MKYENDSSSWIEQITDVKMNDVIRAIQENVFEGPSRFSNRFRTMKNLAMIALTTAGTRHIVEWARNHLNEVGKLTVHNNDKRCKYTILEVDDTIPKVCEYVSHKNKLNGRK